MRLTEGDAEVGPEQKAGSPKLTQKPNGLGPERRLHPQTDSDSRSDGSLGN